MAVSPGSTSIGLVGLGNLGLPLACTLMRAGWDLTVLDTRPEPVQACVEHGATAAKDRADLVDCDVLVLVVPDDAAVRGVLEGPGGHLDGSCEGRAVIVHSTVLPETARQLAEVAAERGVDLLDAPVSGGSDRAASGELTVMVGGDDGALERLRPLLETVGDDVIHVGPAGAGAAAKLANQLAMFANLAGLHEALDLAAAHGVAPEPLLAVLATSTGDSWVARNWGFFDRTAAAYDAGGTPVAARPWSKDLDEIVQAARTVEVPVPLAGWLAQTVAARVEAHAAKANGGDR
ncbi:NAD(P)-dependent oxidoreductase [Pseudonocardia nigra]|uniref:NAD(P)-dependent oxidoreductase n=1 Tax=Pseudonocardia nigra TaxID=1921578 RepID=UPI001C5DE92E|nr:NAD(P)-dependent oxidoreductase [Pseudonocardia nigra]